MKDLNAHLKLVARSTGLLFLIAVGPLSFAQSPDEEILLRGLKHAEVGNLELAKQEFLKASAKGNFLKIISDSEEGKIKKDTAVGLLAGISLLFQGRIDDAIDKETAAIRLDPQYAQAYVERSRSFFFKAKLAPSWVRVKREDGTYTMFNVGEDAGRKSLLKSAIEDGEQAVQIDPKLAGAYDVLAGAYMLSGNKDKAEYYENKVKELTKK
jgi:tetratricopeptide (TPR) repeat protein